MNDPFTYQNDLLRASNEMTNYLQGRASATKKASQKGLLERATDLRKKGEDLQKSAQSAQKAVELGLGATVGPKTVDKLIKPVANRVGKLLFRGGGGEGQLSGSRAVRGLEAEGDTPESTMSSARGLEEIRPNVYRGATARTGQGQNVEMAQRSRMVEEESKGGDGFEETKSPADGLEGEEAEGAEGVEGVEGAEGAEGVEGAEAIEGAGEAVEGAAAVGGAVEGGVGAVAAADAWNPLGWILGAGLAIAGIVEGAESGTDNAAAQQQQHLADAVQLPKSPPVNFAGKLVVPVQTAVAQE